uniref:SCP domain-containing protein n=1 Tax=Mesocestoides corti TaxID=53468 RepID=A0A5K3FXK2_MESCO
MHPLFAISAFIWLVMAEPPTNKVREEIVEFHTRIRENVNPPASNMQLMNYSLKLENLAKEAAQLYCAGSNANPSVHAQFQGCGIVLDLADKKSDSIYSNLNAIYEQGQQPYNYDTNTCTGYCSYFKTMVWSQTTEVGCAIGACQLGTRFLTACLYKPGEFDPQSRPYEKGQSCTKCPNGFACSRNQCKKSLTSVATTSSATTTSTLPATSSATITSALPNTSTKTTTSTLPTTTSATITATLHILPSLLLMFQSLI